MEPGGFPTALVAVLLAFATCAVAPRLYRALPVHRHTTIDGLRGYLAFFVFLSHAAVWQSYLHTGRWLAPTSALYAHFGRAGVAMFFMITAFLFCSKVIDARRGSIDWVRLFSSRVVRLTPMYVVAVLVMLGIVAIVGRGQSLHEPVLRVMLEAVQWLTFTITGAPDVNGVTDTGFIMAGVTWTLSFEWLFYVMLPTVALLLGVRVPVHVALVGAAIGCFIAWFIVQPWLLVSFAPGILTAFAARSQAFVRFARHRAAGVLALGCMTLAIYATRSPDSAGAIALYGVAFAMIACGNPLFGALTCSPARALGEVSYSIYLLHGIVLYVTFSLLIGERRAASLTATEYRLVILAMAPVLVALATACFALIERPALDRRTRFERFVRAVPLGWRRSIRSA